MGRNIKWNEEEEILLLELYFKLKGTSYYQGHPDIIELSNLLRKRAENLNIPTDDKYRNTTGIFMKLKNLESVENNGLTGLPNYSELDVNLYNKYQTEISQLNIHAQLIRENILNYSISGD